LTLGIHFLEELRGGRGGFVHDAHCGAALGVSVKQTPPRKRLSLLRLWRNAGLASICPPPPDWASSMDAARLLPSAGAEARRRALSLAAQHGNAEIVRLLLDAGEDPNRYNLEGNHAHSTPLHQAVLEGHETVVRLLVDRGARLGYPGYRLAGHAARLGALWRWKGAGGDG
jgi:hypothetical protein